MSENTPAQSAVLSVDLAPTHEMIVVGNRETGNTVHCPDRIGANTCSTIGRKISIVIAIISSFVLVGFDQNIIATAVPAITQDYHTTSDIGWYNSVYRLATSSFQPLFGKSYSLFPTRRVYLASLILFGCGSLLSGFAPTSTAFIIGRALTGIAAAGVISGAFSLITYNFPLRQRTIYAGFGGGAEAIAAACAPLLGGVLTDQVSWRWCFFLQLPFVVLTLVTVGMCSRMSSADSRPLRQKLGSLDFLGTTTFVSAVTSLLLATQFGATQFAWSNWRIILLLTLSAPMLMAFFYIQHRRQEDAVLPPRVALSRNVLSGMLFSSVNNGGLSIIEYYMPLYFQICRGMSATMSGATLLPLVIGLIISVVLSGYLTSIIGYYNPFMLATSILTPIASGLLTTITWNTPVWKIIIFQSILGVGAGIGFQGPQVAVQTILSNKDTSVGIGIIQFAQGIGPAIFIAASQSIFWSQLKKGLETSGVTDEITSSILTGSSPFSLSIDVQDQERVSSVYAQILSRTFYLPFTLSCFSAIGALGMEWRSVKLDRPVAEG